MVFSAPSAAGDSERWGGARKEHGRSANRSFLAGAVFRLGARAPIRLRGSVLLAEAVTQTFLVDLSAQPRWVIIGACTLVAVLGIWIVMKLLKWTLWLLLLVVLVGGLAWAGWEFVQ